MVLTHRRYVRSPHILIRGIPLAEHDKLFVLMDNNKNGAFLAPYWISLG